MSSNCLFLSYVTIFKVLFSNISFNANTATEDRSCWHNKRLRVFWHNFRMHLIIKLGERLLTIMVKKLNLKGD